MIPGTRPARRSARAAPLPPRERVAALIWLTVAIVDPRVKSCNQKRNPRQPPGVPVMPRGCALITAHPPEDKEMPRRPWRRGQSEGKWQSYIVGRSIFGLGAGVGSAAAG